MAKDHIVDYDTTAGNNTDIDGVSIAEGMAPSNVNNAKRELMADLAELYGDIGGSLVSAGSGGAFTLTTNDNVAAYAQKQFYMFEANHAMPDTATATLNINAIGAKPLRKHVTLNLENGDIAANQMVAVCYEATNDCFHVLSPLADAPIVQGTHSLWIPAAAMDPNVSNGCAVLTKAETTSGRPDIRSLDFDKDSDKFAQFAVAMPKSWDEGTITFIPYWTHKTSTAAYGVAWFLQAVACADGDTIDVAYGTAQSSVDTGGTDEDQYVGPESSAITVGGAPAAGELTHFQIYRDVSDAGDTLDADACLLGIIVKVTINAKDDS